MQYTFGNTPLESLRIALSYGRNNANSGVDAARSGLNAVTNSGAIIRKDAANMRDQARLVNSQGDSINATADAILKLVPTLTPYVDKLGGYSDDFDAMSNALLSRSNDAFGQASALTSMDPNATGLAAEFLKQYGAMSPDNYVSRAASDAQSSAQNALAQSERDLARRGVSAGSGASLDLRRQYQRALAELSASVKTKAWNEGNKAQGDFLGMLTNAANTFYGMGTQGAAQALAAKSEAGKMQQDAAGILKSQGDLMQNAGNLRSTAGQLFANAASIFGSAAGVESNYASLLQSAYGNLSSAYQAAANYYQSAASTEVSAMNGGGGTVRTNVTTVPRDDWMNWKGTGHSETWNKNNNPNYWNLISR